MGDDDWNRLRYAEVMQSVRLLSTQVTQYNLGITLALVTLLGFSVDRESWGLAALGLALEALMYFVIEVHRRATKVLLEEAAGLERPSGDESTAAAMYAVMSGRRGQDRAMGQVALLVAIPCHLLLVIYLATVQGWALAGGS